MRSLIWSKSALKSFEKILDFIEKDSRKNAEKVALAILKKVNYSKEHPEFYRRDKYKIDNSTGAFRAFEIYSIRVSFYYDDEVIRIIRVRHTKQKPLQY